MQTGAIQYVCMYNGHVADITGAFQHYRMFSCWPIAKFDTSEPIGETLWDPR